MRTRWTAWGLLAVCLVCAFDVSAELRTTRSESYTIHTDLSDEQLAPFAEHLDEIHDAYTGRFSTFAPRREAKPDLYLFFDRQTYVNYLATKDIDASGSGGMFFVRDDESGLATWVNNRPTHHTLQTLQHEGFHQFAYEHIGPDLPLWVNEGLAVYFENARLVGGTMKTGIATQHGVERLKGLLKNGGLIEFETLLKTDSEQWFANMRSPDRGTLQYLQSWSIVFFLIHGQDGKYRKHFEAYLRHIAAGDEHASAFRKAFGADSHDTFAARWREFVAHELEPDPYSTALDRLEFLAAGVVALHENDMRKPRSLAELRATLNRVRFRLTVSTQGERVVFRADDPELYRYRDARNHLREFTFTARRGPGLAGFPEIVAPHLRFKPRIAWFERDGEIEYEVIFE